MSLYIKNNNRCIQKRNLSKNIVTLKFQRQSKDCQLFFIQKIVETTGFVWATPDGLPPRDEPVCGFWDDLCPPISQGIAYQLVTCVFYIRSDQEMVCSYSKEIKNSKKQQYSTEQIKGFSFLSHFKIGDLLGNHINLVTHLVNLQRYCPICNIFFLTLTCLKGF